MQCNALLHGSRFGCAFFFVVLKFQVKALSFQNIYLTRFYLGFTCKICIKFFSGLIKLFWRVLYRPIFQVCKLSRGALRPEAKGSAIKAFWPQGRLLPEDLWLCFLSCSYHAWNIHLQNPSSIIYLCYFCFFPHLSSTLFITRSFMWHTAMSTTQYNLSISHCQIVILNYV